MVRAALEEAKEMCKAKLLHFKGKSEDVIIETSNTSDSGDELATSKSEDQPVFSRSESVMMRPNETPVVSSPPAKQGPPSGKIFVAIK